MSEREIVLRIRAANNGYIAVFGNPNVGPELVGRSPAEIRQAVHAELTRRLNAIINDFLERQDKQEGDGDDS